jgi:hypothetical protein
VDAANKTRSTVRELGECYETIFPSSEAKLADSLSRALGRIENATEDMQFEIPATLWPVES